MKTAIFIGTIVGSVAGAMIPGLWGDFNPFSVFSLILSSVGSLVGFLAGIKIGEYFEL